MAPTRILIVEDETIVAMDLEQTLRGFGFEVVGVEGSADAAIERAAALVPDLIVMDVRLKGGGDGIDAARAIQTRNAIPILFLTAHADAATVERAKLVAPYGYVVKPFDHRDLRRSIELALSKAAGEREIMARSADDLWSSEERYRLLVDAVQDYGINTIDSNGVITTWNSGAERMFGYEAAEVVGTSIQRLFLPGATDATDLEPLQSVLDRVRSGERVERDEWRVRKDGSKFLARVVRSPIFGRSGAFDGSVAVIRDVTRERALEADQLQTQKLEGLGKLAGGIAHDFNNMLMVIFSRCDILERKGGLTADQLRHISDIRAAASKNRALTQQLLAAARRQVLEPQVVDLKKDVASAMELLRLTLGEHIMVRQSLDDVWSIYADPARLHQVILNLAVNAKEAMPDGGILTVETRNVVVDEAYARQKFRIRAGDYVALVVSDNGVGIPEEIRDRIFDPFFTSRKGGGSGLGLSVVRGVVEQTGGAIWMYSEVGQGTTFKIFFPRHQGEVAEGVHVEPEKEPPRGEGTILIVEDEQLLRSVIRESLEESGYQVLDARTPGEALAIVERGETPRLLLTDIVLPEMNGFELAAVIHRRYPELPTVFMSGYTDQAINGEPLRSRIFLEKPISTRDLLTAVHAALHAGEGSQER
ncbi:MAG TPA: response regulator [Thermoanaerobaculia bacterium]